MSVSGSQVAAHFQRQAQLLEPVLTGYRQLLADIHDNLRTIAEQVMRARRELAAIYLPALTDQAIERVARLTGFQGFARRDPRTALAHERHVLEQSLAKFDGNERFVNREAELAQLGSELASARDTLAPLEAECQRFESLVGFSELVTIGYDTPRFSEKWWQASYWKHWAAGDRICKALDMNDFGDDVLPAYSKVSEPRNYMRDEVRRIEGLIDGLHGLVQERDRLAGRLANLDAIFLGESQDYLGEHLELADSALLEQWAEAEPELVRPIQIGLRKLAGLRAKRQFLGDLATGVTGLTGQLEQRQAKARQKQGKFSRPKNTYAQFPDAMVQDGFDHKISALSQQRDKTGRRVTALMAADQYAGFDLGQDQELWWIYLMQAPPPRLAPNLFDYYQRHPGATPVTDPDYVDAGPSPGELAAAAYAAGELEQGGAYLS